MPLEVLMLELARKHIGESSHPTMRVIGESCAGGDLFESERESASAEQQRRRGDREGGLGDEEEDRMYVEMVEHEEGGEVAEGGAVRRGEMVSISARSPFSQARDQPAKQQPHPSLLLK